MTPFVPEQEGRVARALGVFPVGVVPDELRQFAEAWFGPECVWVEVIGRSFTEYDDEHTYENGDIEVLGFTATGTRLQAQFLDLGSLEIPDEWERSTYFEALADYAEQQALIAAGEAVEDPLPKPGATTSMEYGSEDRERFMEDRSELPEGVFCYWGPPEQDPYKADRELQDRIGELLN